MIEVKPSANTVYIAECGHRLPCGICRLTMCNCPKGNLYNVTPTWITTGTGTAPVEEYKINCNFMEGTT